MTFRAQLFWHKIKASIETLFGRVFVFQQRHRNKYLLSIVLVSVVLFVASVLPTAALDMKDITDALNGFIATILYAIAYGIGWIAMQIFSVTVWLSSYNEFVNTPAVEKGWVLIRDVCNMIVVILLLIYAFATILRISKYSEKKILPRLLIAAVLINFSKLIAGLAIDAAQVFMLTFVNGYAATAGANLIQGLGLQQVLAFGPGSGGTTNWTEVYVFLMFAILFLIATLTIIVMITMMLAIRIAVLWVLVVVSPFGFLGISQFPRLSDYTSKWWDMFFNWLIIGPLLAFFLWLALLVMADPSSNIDPDGKLQQLQQEAEQHGAIAASPKNKLSALNNLATATISLALLYAAYMMAKKIAGSASPVLAGLVTGAGKKAGGFAAKFTGVPQLSREVAGTYKSYASKVQAKQSGRTAARGERLFLAREKGVRAVKKTASYPAGALMGGARSVPGGVASGAKGAAGGYSDAYAKARAAGEGRLASFGKGMKGGVVGAGVEGVSGGFKKGLATFKKTRRSIGSLEDRTLQDAAEKKKREFAAQMFDMDSSSLAESAMYGRDDVERAAAMERLVATKDLDALVPEEMWEKDPVAARQQQGKVVREVAGTMSGKNKSEFEKLFYETDADLVLDVTKKDGRTAYEKGVASGAIDITKQSKRAFGSATVVQAMSNGEPKFAKKFTEWAGKSAANKKAAEDITSRNLTMTVNANGDVDAGLQKTQEVMQAVHFNVTGDATAFKSVKIDPTTKKAIINPKTGEPETSFDKSRAQTAIRSAKPDTLKMVGKMISTLTKSTKPKDQDALRDISVVLPEIKKSQIKSMVNAGENESAEAVFSQLIKEYQKPKQDAAIKKQIESLVRSLATDNATNNEFDFSDSYLGFKINKGKTGT